MADKLDRIFELHMRFNKNYAPAGSQQRRDLGRVCTAISQETAELHELAGWKWWGAPPPPFDIGKAKEELADIMHFVVQAAITLRMSPEEFLAQFERKSNINVERQKRYDGLKAAEDIQGLFEGEDA